MTKEEALPFIAAIVFGFVSIFIQIMSHLNKTGKFPQIADVVFLSNIGDEKRALIILRIFCTGLFLYGIFSLVYL